jgi:NAD(P)-dependent dehydrogenase (short-subunit alcohol dehydrogenase family)
MASMDGKVALVTGASSGIGRAAALRLAGAGASVALGARRTDVGEQTVELIQAAGGEALFVRTDVAREADVRALVDACLAAYDRLDIAFNNAGIEGRIRPLVDYDEPDWDAVLDTNLKGVFLCLKHEIRHMAANGGGAIVNTASIGAHVGFPGMAHYTAAKHGVLGLTKTAAIEYAAAGVRVNAISPGLIDTPMDDRFTGGPDTDTERFVLSLTPRRRRGTPLEVADTVLWLCSDAASYITGAAVSVDGGFLTI